MYNSFTRIGPDGMITRQGTESGANPPPTYNPNQNNQSPNSHGQGGWIAFSILLCVVILIIVGATLLFNQANNSQKATTNVTTTQKSETETYIASTTMRAQENTTLQNSNEVSEATLPNGDPDPEPFILQLNQRYLSASELEQFTQVQETYIRNGVLALSGRIFVNPDYSSYFNGKSWYTPLYEGDVNTEDHFNEYQTANLAVCVQYEKDHGWRPQNQ